MHENLSLLSDIELDAQCINCVKLEREATERVIRHLAEIESRRLHVVLGYHSMFEYITRRLGYPEATAMRRLKVARAQIKLPQVAEALEKREVSLSALEACADVLIRADGPKILEELKGKTHKEAERLALMYLPVHPKELRDQVKLVAVAPIPLELPSKDVFTSNRLRNDLVENSDADVYRFEFAADASFKVKLEYVQDLMFNGTKESAALRTVFEKTLDEYIEHHCPKAREERRLARQQKAAESVETPIASPSEAQPEQISTDDGEVKKIPGPISNRGFSSPSPQRSFDPPIHKRRIPVWLRDKVLARDNYQCVYEGPNGTRCTCKSNLEIDHIRPFARGGETKLENLRTLCQVHNLQAEIQVFGRPFVTEKVGGVGQGLS